MVKRTPSPTWDEVAKYAEEYCVFEQRLANTKRDYPIFEDSPHSIFIRKYISPAEKVFGLRGLYFGLIKTLEEFESTTPAEFRSTELIRGRVNEAKTLLAKVKRKVPKDLR